jgi:hypothetical protein
MTTKQKGSSRTPQAWIAAVAIGLVAVFGSVSGGVALPRVTESLRLAAARLRAAEARVRVVLVGYHLVPGLEAQISRLNRAIERAARGAHVSFVDTARPFDRYARQHHGDLCTTGLLIVPPDGSGDLHPTRIGQGLIASAVLAAARDELSSGVA